MEAESTKTVRLFWGLTTVVGWSLGLTVGLAIGEVLGRYANIAFYEQVGPIGSAVRDIFAGACVGLSLGILQRFVPSSRFAQASWSWPLKSALVIAIGFAITRVFGNPVVRDIDYGVLLNFGFDLPPRWLPTSVGLANYEFGGPIAGAIVGLTSALLLPPFLQIQIKNWGRWIILTCLPTTIGFTLGTIPSLLDFDLIIIAIITAFCIAAVDILVYTARIHLLTSESQ